MLSKKIKHQAYPMDPDHPDTDCIMMQSYENDLEIYTKDEQILHVSRRCLCTMSAFFRKIFGSTENFGIDSIRMPYQSDALTVLFKCMNDKSFGQRDEVIANKYFQKLRDSENVCDFLSACHEFETKLFIDLYDNFFSGITHIQPLLSTRFLALVDELQMKKTRRSILMLFDLSPDFLNNFNFQEMKCKDLISFSLSWDPLLGALRSWTSFHDPTDCELAQSVIPSLDYNQAPSSTLFELYNIFQRLNNPIQFKVKITNCMKQSVAQKFTAIKSRCRKCL